MRVIIMLYVLTMCLLNIVNYAMILLILYLDINKCDDDTDDCEQICTNTKGSFNCSCMSGYTLDDNGKNCTGESFTKVIDFSYLHNFIYEGCTNDYC